MRTLSAGRPWLANLFPASAGRSATTNSIGRAIGRGPDTHMWIREARVLGFETLDLPAGRLDTVLIEWDDAGTGNNYHRSRYWNWLDTATGVTVRAERRILGGSGPEYAWHATSISHGRPVASPPSHRPRRQHGPPPQDGSADDETGCGPAPRSSPKARAA